MLTKLASLTRFITSVRLVASHHHHHARCYSCSSPASSSPLPPVRIGILPLPSSLPDVINQFEDYLVGELDKCRPQVQVIRIPADDHVRYQDEVIHNSSRFDDDPDDDPIPYVICLDEELLDRGIVKLWNKETTLRQEIHSSRIVNHIKQYFCFIHKSEPPV